MTELSEKTHTLAQRLAREQGLSIDETIKRALEARLSAGSVMRKNQGGSEIIKARREALDDFIAKIVASPILDQRSSQEIMDDLDPL